MQALAPAMRTVRTVRTQATSQACRVCAAVPRAHRHRRPATWVCSSQISSPQPQGDDQFEGLSPEEDAEIPGSYRDAMSSNTQLGKAVKDACSELDALAGLEEGVLNEAEELLKKVGWKGSLFKAEPAQGDGGSGGAQ